MDISQIGNKTLIGKYQTGNAPECLSVLMCVFAYLQLPYFSCICHDVNVSVETPTGPNVMLLSHGNILFYLAFYLCISVKMISS